MRKQSDRVALELHGLTVGIGPQPTEAETPPSLELRRCHRCRRRLQGRSVGAGTLLPSRRLQGGEGFLQRLHAACPQQRCGGIWVSTLPACINAMRSQRSPSFMKWVEMKIVTPCVRDRSISKAQKLSRATGSTLDVGSSDQDVRPVDHGHGQRQTLAHAQGQAIRQGVHYRT